MPSRLHSGTPSSTDSTTPNVSRAERDSTALAAAIGTRVDRTQQAVARVAATPTLTGFLSDPQRTTTTTARASLLTLATSTDDGVRDVMVQDLDGDVRLWISGGKVMSGQPRQTPDDAVLAATLRLDGAGSYASTVHADASGSPAVTIAAPIRSADDDVTGIVRVDVSLAQILGTGASGLVGGSVLAELQNQSGATITQARGTGAVVPADGVVATAVVPGFPGWRVRVTEPRQSTPTPLVLIGGLAVVVFAIGLLIFWMACKVIRPAEELETSRRRLGELYEGARLDALRDALTGLGNHRAFHEEFDRQLENASRSSTPLALVLIDLDDFKLVNDTSGHAAGDELLAEMGRLTSATTRTADRAFRIGGDEFAVLMPHTDPDGARVVGRRLLASALETRPGSSVPNSFSFSIGISGFPDLTTDRRQLYAQADSALYWAKTHGRTMVQIFDPGAPQARGQPPGGRRTRRRPSPSWSRSGH